MTFCVQISGSDADLSAPYKTVMYEISGGDAANEYFQINPANGQIAVKKSLQLDTQRRGQITVHTSTKCHFVEL